MNVRPRLPRRRRADGIVALAALLASALLPAAALACLWDYDTIRDERRGLPGIAEVLAGKWERHSAFFYEDRVRRMTALLAREPSNWAAYDNLAVALEKLGRPAEAIAVMRKKDGLSPGQYTTHANLGTFLLHTGQLDEGIDEIKKALAINPAAHFGREEYQLKLAEFLRDGRRDPWLPATTNFLRVGRDDLAKQLAELPATGPSAGPSTRSAPATAPTASTPAATGPSTGASTGPASAPADEEAATTREYLIASQVRWTAGRGSPGRLASLGLKDNVFDGLVGIVRFGTGTSAELYLTLGDLLALRGDKNLAYRAYQRALDFNHPRAEYLRAAREELATHGQDRSAMTPEAVAAERAAADAWVRAYQQYEDDLIRAGKDPDDEANLAGFYAASGPAVTPVPFDFVEDVLPRGPEQRAAAAFLAGLAALLLAGLFVVARRLRKRRAVATARRAAAAGAGAAGR